MFPEELERRASELLGAARGNKLTLATAESCTGGLLSALLTEIPGASAVFDRGFVVYSKDAKVEMLGVRASLIADHGAVSREVAIAMAEGALVHSQASLAIAVTGLAGPGGGTALKPVGLVHFAAVRLGAAPLHRECRFGAQTRSEIRLLSLGVALTLAGEAMQLPSDGTV